MARIIPSSGQAIQIALVVAVVFLAYNHVSQVRKALGGPA